MSPTQAATRPVEQAARRADRATFHERHGRLVDRALLAAIGVVVVLVSLPRLRDFALRANERDAWRMTGLLGEALAAEVADTGQVPALEALIARPGLDRQLDDVEVLSGGRVLRRHGYLFELVRLGPASAEIRAWPWEHGRSGLGAFRWNPRAGLLGTPNEDAAWSGPASPDALASGWRAIRARH